MNFYAQLEKALLSADINTKELIVDSAIEYCQDLRSHFSEYEPIVYESPSYAKICKIVKPKELPKRGDFSKEEGQLALTHSIAHIEFSAIDLAIDAVYRFTNMPREYKLDWLIVAQDEIRHFKMLRGVLNSLDADYGDLPVHNGLFEMAYKTNGDIIERMAIIPRYFEASGLDVNPKIINKLKNYKRVTLISELIEALTTIYNEEIEHVRKGDRWFRYLCEEEGSSVTKRYLEILDKYSLKGRANQYNIKARKEAGFSCNELIALGVKECK